MNESNSVVIFTKAALMLAEADTIQKAKELKSLALTAADWAKRHKMGEAAIQHCRSYALEAERKMGEMLMATKDKRAKGAATPGVGKRGVHGEPHCEDEPTLANGENSQKKSLDKA